MKGVGHMYNMYFNPPREDTSCDVCGKKLFQRKDDHLETIQERLKVYRAQTMPLIEYYQTRNKLVTMHLDGNEEPNQIFDQVCNIVES